MSVYTSVDDAQLAQFLLRYDIGEAVSLQPIAAGITNSNYWLECTSGAYVLTLYEHHSDDELVYMLGLQRHLAQHGVACSQPVQDRREEFFSTLNQRPAAIIERLPGTVVSAPSARECALIGGELARFHLAGADFDKQRANPRGLDWIVAVRDMLVDHLDDIDRLAIEASLRTVCSQDLGALPMGAIHADLFHDNALFNEAGLGGILDFDYACHDSFVFDIAVLLNDWCVDQDYRLDAQRVEAVLEAYRQVRELQPIEVDALPVMLRLAALRFWMSRLYDKAYPLAGELTFIKSPDAFRQMHRLRSEDMSLPG